MLRRIELICLKPVNILAWGLYKTVFWILKGEIIVYKRYPHSHLVWFLSPINWFLVGLLNVSFDLIVQTEDEKDG